jgi:hypothetical protein
VPARLERSLDVKVDLSRLVVAMKKTESQVRRGGNFIDGEDKFHL